MPATDALIVTSRNGSVMPSTKFSSDALAGPAEALITKAAHHLLAGGTQARELGGEDPFSLWHGFAGQLDLTALQMLIDREIGGLKSEIGKMLADVSERLASGIVEISQYPKGGRKQRR